MLDSHFERLRSEVGRAVRQPDFGTVRRRARRVRRRRAVASSAVFLATLLTVVGLGYAVRNAPEDRGVVGSTPATDGGTDGDWPRTTSVTATGADLFVLLVRCRDCGSQLYASSNGGASWQHRAVPPEPKDAVTPRSVSLTPLAPGVLIWTEAHLVSVDEALKSAIPAHTRDPAHTSGPAHTRDPAHTSGPSGVGGPPTGAGTSTLFERLWITNDGGSAWRRITVDSGPLLAVPSGMRSVDCDQLQISTCTVGAIDPATGRFAPLATQGTRITLQSLRAGQVNAPLDGHLWVSGTDPATGKPAVATSSDGGWDWRTHVFTDGVAAEFDNGMTAMKYLPQVTAGSGDTAYVLTYRADGVVDAHYTADGGKTWHAGGTIRDARSVGGFVTADGSHIVATGTGFVAGRGAGGYTPVTLPGFPADFTRETQVTSRQATERYLVNSGAAVYLSRDGLTWRRVHLP